MESTQFTVSLLRASAEGFAGIAASRMFENGSAVDGAAQGFDAWKAQLRGQVMELAAAVEDGLPDRFCAHLAWSRDAFAARGLSADGLRAGLARLGEVLEESLTGEAWAPLPEFLDRAMTELARSPSASESELDADEAGGKLAEQYVTALLAGAGRRAIALVCAAIEAGELAADQVIESVLAPALREIGRRWHLGEVTVAEEHFASFTTTQALTRILAMAPPAESNGRTVLLTAVAGDPHEIGIRFASAFFELDGWASVCLGADTPAEDLAHMAARLDADLVCIGATLDRQRESVARTIQALRAARPGQRVLVGGSAFGGDAEVARRVGADASVKSAREAVRIARDLLRP